MPVGVNLSSSSRPGRSAVRRMSLIEEIQLTNHKESAIHFIPLSKPRAYIIFLMVLPIFVSVWYSCAVFFPPEARSAAPLLLWTDGILTKNQEGKFAICPRASICSEGIFEIILIGFARLSAFASYVICCLTFASKMHSTIHFLSNSYFGHFIPFESLHHLHISAGSWYAYLACLHTATHLIRYYERAEFLTQMKTQTAISGTIAMLAMVIVVWSMTVAKRFKWLSFEHRFNFHWMFILLAAALCFHVRRARLITLASV